MKSGAKFLPREQTRAAAAGWALREMKIDVRPDEIVGAIASAFDCTKDELLKRGRPSLSLVLPRHIAAYLIRELCGLSYREIERALNQDHSGVTLGCRKVAVLVETDKRVRHIVQRLKSELTAMAEAAQ